LTARVTRHFKKIQYIKNDFGVNPAAHVA